MEPTRRPEDEVQLNKTPAEQEEPEYSLEEIMNEFGGWTKREEQAAEPGETVRLASPAGRAPDAPASEEDEEPADTIRFAPVHTKTESEPERPAVWTYQGEPDPEPAAADPREARERARAERRERRQAEKRRRQLERFQKKEARKKRAAEQPEHVFSSLEAAYQFYSAASSVRLRLLLSVLTCLASILLLVLSASSVIGDFSGYSRVFSAIMLGLLLAQALLSYDICLSGVMQALRLRFDQTSMLFVVLCAVIVDAFFAVMQGRTPFCTVASVLLLLALWGRSLLYEARRRSLRAAGNMEEPVAAMREEKAWHGYDCIFRAPGDAAQFAIQLEMPDAGSRIMRVYAPVMTAVTLVLSILTAMRGGKSFLWSWTAMLLAGFPAGVLIAYAKPFSTFAKKLYRVGAAVAGWQGARILSGEAGLIIEDADLFPPQNVTQGGMKLYGTLPAGQVLSYALAALEAAQDPLAALFDRLLQAQFGRRCRADAYRCYDGGGIGAQIGQDVVLVGSLPFMRSMGVHMSDGARVRQAVYVSVNGELAGIFAVKYKPSASTRAGLRALLANPGNSVILATRDFLITPELLAARYELAVGGIAFPVYSERLRLSEAVGGEADAQGALIAKETFGAFASAVAAAQTLRSTTRFSTILSLLSGILGLCLCALLLYWGSAAAVSPFHIAAFQLIWALVAGFLSGILQRL